MLGAYKIICHSIYETEVPNVVIFATWLVDEPGLLWPLECHPYSLLGDSAQCM